jgi:hypothetical protein
VSNVDKDGGAAGPTRIDVYANSDTEFKGEVLFSVDDGKEEVTKMSSKSFYNSGIQFASDNLPNYMQLIYLSPNIGKYVKSFTTRDLVRFTESRIKSESDLLKFHKWGIADWKESADGANSTSL